MNEPAPLRLEMAGIWKSFGGVAVLREVGLRLRAGEVLALLGSNGAGKSTLVKILNGLYSRDKGTIRLDGAEVVIERPAGAVAHGVRMLPQEVSVLPDMTVAENIFIGDLPSRPRLGIAHVDRGRMRAESHRLLTQLGLDVDPDRQMSALSVPEQRIVEIARALAGDARVLVMDEPTAALTEQEAQLLFEIIGRLKRSNVSVIYISHYLSEVFQVSDRIAVLRDGRNAGEFDTAKASQDEVLVAMLGDSVADLFPKRAPRPDGAGSDRQGQGAEILRVEGLSLPGALREVSLDVRAGEIVGVFGLIGSGNEVIGRAIYGALGATPGATMRVEGRGYAPRDPRRARNAGIGFVAAERKKEGIIDALTLRENLTMPFLNRFLNGLTISVRRERSHTERWIRQLNIQARGPDQPMRTLSGGNQQKVCIARWLVEGMKALILEEPTRGVDMGARREIYGELRRLADQGLAILVVSSDAEEVAGLCDRMVVLDRGRVAARFAHGASPAALMSAASETALAETAAAAQVAG